MHVQKSKTEKLTSFTYSKYPICQHDGCTHLKTITDSKQEIEIILKQIHVMAMPLYRAKCG